MAEFYEAINIKIINKSVAKELLQIEMMTKKTLVKVLWLKIICSFGTYFHNC